MALNCKIITKIPKIPIDFKASITMLNVNVNVNDMLLI